MRGVNSPRYKLGECIMIRVEILTHNAAFQDGNKGAEIARILRKMAEYAENWDFNAACMDYNGNKVGNMRLILDDDGAEL
jgi:hypothetical protein